MADKNVPTANKNWLDWDTESTLKFLRGKYLLNSKTAKMDVDQVIEKTIIDLTPESRTKLNKLILSLQVVKNYELEKAIKRGVVVENIEKDMVDKLIKRAKKTAKCPNGDMRTRFLKEVEGKKPKTLEDLHVAILSAWNTYQDLIINAANYGATVVVQTTADDHTPKSEDKGGEKNKKQGGEKSRKEERDYSKNCSACGRPGHTAGENSCYYIWAKHPDFNKDWKKTRFDKSEKGKAWIAKGKNSVAINSKLDGTKWEFGEKSFAAFTEATSKKRKREGKNIHSHSCYLLEETEVSPVSTAHTLRCGIITPRKKSYVDILIDTGALQGNYLSSDVAQWLRHQGVEEKNEKIKVCSFKGCEAINSYFLVDFSLYDIVSRENIIIEKIKTWLLPNCPCDIILGRNTLEKYDLLKRIDLSDKKYTHKIHFLENKTTIRLQVHTRTTTRLHCVIDKKVIS